MNQTALIWLVLAPHCRRELLVNNRWLAVLPRAKPKTLWLRLLELVLLYFAVGALGLALEQRVGQIYPQGWEFYATTASLFLAGLPGFVYRYLYKRRGG